MMNKKVLAWLGAGVLSAVMVPATLAHTHLRHLSESTTPPAKASGSLCSPVTSTVAGLRTLLMARGGAWQTALAQGRALRVAVNQEMAQPATPVKPGDEIAFFPPVTGG